MSCYVYCDEVTCNMLSHMVEKYHFQGIASLLSHRRTVWAAHLSPSGRKCHLSTQEFEEVTRSVSVLSLQGGVPDAIRGGAEQQQHRSLQRL